MQRRRRRTNMRFASNLSNPPLTLQCLYASKPLQRHRPQFLHDSVVWECSSGSCGNERVMETSSTRFREAIIRLFMTNLSFDVGNGVAAPRRAAPSRFSAVTHQARILGSGLAKSSESLGSRTYRRLTVRSLNTEYILGANLRSTARKPAESPLEERRTRRGWERRTPQSLQGLALFTPRAKLCPAGEQHGERLGGWVLRRKRKAIFASSSEPATSRGPSCCERLGPGAEISSAVV